MSDFIIGLMCFFAILGGIDKIIGNKYGMGERFEQGFMSMGSMALSILGIYSLAPFLATILLIFIEPICKIVHIDPSVFSGILLAPDMGGYSVAEKIANHQNTGLYSGLILSSMMGTTLSFTIPMAGGIIEKEDYKFFSKGLLIGIITIPVGALAGAILCGLNFGNTVINIIPVILISIPLVIGMKIYPNKTIKGFNAFSNIIQIIGLIGLILGIIDRLMGIKLIGEMESLNEGLKVVGGISVILAGAYPMMYILTKYLHKPLNKFGNAIGINEVAVAGLIATLANNVASFGMMKDMDERGKVINSAFSVSGAFILGGQMAFVASTNSDMMAPFIISKIAAGICAVTMSYGILKKESKRLQVCA